MTKEVIIKISGLQYMDDADEPIELITKGEYYNRNGKHYLKYDEIVEGVEGVSKCTVKFKEDSFEILKKGSTNVHMVFECGKKNVTYYGTPFGTILLGLDTRGIELKEREEEIVVEVDYGMDVNYEFLSECHIRMNICPVTSGDFKLVS